MKHPILPRGKELGLPILSGILLWLCFPPFHLLIPPLVALTPYLVFVASSAHDQAGAASVRRASFWMGMVFYGALLYWLFIALVYYTWLSLLGYLITVIVLSAFLALAGWAIHLLRARHDIPFWASLPIFWTAIEWLRAHLGDIAFPWLGLGHSLTAYPWLVGFADVTGARGVTFWLTAVNGALAEWWLAGWRVRWPQRAATFLLLLGLPVGYSLFRYATLETRVAARVLVVQPNIPEHLKLDRDQAEDSSRTALGALTNRALSTGAKPDLVVWPETALPNFFEQARGWTLWAATLARRNDVALLFGALDLERYRSGGFDYYNAAVYLNEEGNQIGVYRKHYLVPVVERVPFVPVAWLRELRTKVGPDSFLRWFGGFGRGREASAFPLNDSSFGVLICYESIFPALSRQFRRDGAEFLINITNDAWFGREHPRLSRTSALYQHPAHLVMRAIEHRVGVARAANTGISMFVDPLGRISHATNLFEPDAVVAEVQTTDELTLYTRFGDWLGWLAAVAALVLLIGSEWQRRRNAGPLAS